MINKNLNMNFNSPPRRRARGRGWSARVMAEAAGCGACTTPRSHPDAAPASPKSPEAWSPTRSGRRVASPMRARAFSFAGSLAAEVAPEWASPPFSNGAEEPAALTFSTCLRRREEQLLEKEEALEEKKLELEDDLQVLAYRKRFLVERFVVHAGWRRPGWRRQRRIEAKLCRTCCSRSATGARSWSGT